MARLGDYVNIKTGKLDANAASENGQYPFFTCAITPLRIDTYSYDCECVLVAGNGDLNVKYYSGKFDAYQRTYIIESRNKNDLSLRYLYYFLEQYVETLRKESIGGVIKYIKLGNLTEAVIPLPPLEEQHRIAALLDKVSDLIAKRRAQLDKLDLLVKSRFVEMFGDQEINTKGWYQSTVGECCTLKSGTSLPADKENEGGSVPYIKVGDMNYPGNEYYITTSSRYVSRTTAGSGVFPVGTVIFPKRGGAIGTNKKRLTTVPICADLNVMGVIAGRLLHPGYLMTYFSMVDLGKLDNGSSVPQINNKDISPLRICLPPMELQEKFTTIIKQSDKTKLTIQQSLDRLETLKNALMQQYFE